MATIECLKESGTKNSAAIVFIHGLMGDIRETWMHKDDDVSTLWPQWLADDLGYSVWLLGYDANLSKWRNNAMPLPDQGDSVLETLATEPGLKQRPLILVGHSMGGLVIKTVIQHGRSKGVQRYAELIKKIYGVVFIATPHNGSQMANLAKFVSVVFRTNPQVGDMTVHNAHLRTLHQQFLAYYEETKIPVRTFAETHGVFLGKKLLGFKIGPTKFVVDPDSSEPHVPGEIAIRLPEDHGSICKPKNREQQLYKSLVAFLEENFKSEIAPLPPEPQLLIHSDRLPTVAGKFFGRKAELEMLDRGWAGDETSIIQFIAPGGTGKTKLLRYWLDQAKDIDILIAWSFYSQGTSEDRQVSATPFFSHAFEKLGSEKTEFATAEDKGEHLAKLLQEQRGVLILDGLEPLQHGGRGMRGELKDRAIRQLLKSLAGYNNGLCIITTRIKVHELSDREEPAVISHDLQNLAVADGVQLLRSLKVKGREVDLKKAVREYGCHALAISLLGNVLRLRFGGDVCKRDTLRDLVKPCGNKESRHAFKVMQAYEEWFEQGPELALLSLLGLFDQPVGMEVLERLRQAQIPDLTKGINPDDWQEAIVTLREEYHLLSRNDHSDDLDCHPLIREYFGDRLRQARPEAWKKAHTLLYEYYKQLPEKELPNTVKEMRPLFRAVAHGCAAGRHQQALDEVFWPRIRRKSEFYTWHKLGAFSDDLATISHFFTKPWRSPAPGLTEADQTAALNWVGFDLRALGRLREAVEPMQASVEVHVKQKEWEAAAINASNLSELQLTLGRVQDAIASGRKSVTYADKSGDRHLHRMGKRSTLADARHQAGESELALTMFQEAEQIQEEYQPEYLRLYSLWGFRYCDLLLALGRTNEVEKRAEYALDIVLNDSRNLLDIALNQLSLGRAHHLQGHFSRAGQWLDKAVKDLREAGAQEFILLGLLARAALWFDPANPDRNYKNAHHDLREVYEIAEPSSMQLHLTDYHLHMARLLANQDKPDLAADHLNQAKQLIEETGYKRRLPELEQLRQ